MFTVEGIMNLPEGDVHILWKFHSEQRELGIRHWEDIWCYWNYGSSAFIAGLKTIFFQFEVIF
jgi:hypothetical protein